MSWIRRRPRATEPHAGRLPDLDFLALVRDALEEVAPGCTAGAGLKGNSLESPHGWAVAVGPAGHGDERHYDLIAFPDVSIQPDVPCFVDCVVVVTTPRDAAGLWARSAGACLLGLLYEHEELAEHCGPDEGRGVPGWRSITSGVLAYGLSDTENLRLQNALLEADVLREIADTFTADLESPWFNGVRVFYGGAPGAVEAEVRVNGERHEAASAALAALGLPEPAVFTVARSFTLVLPVGSGQEAHGHGADGCGCDCGGTLDPEHPGFAHALPHLIGELSPAEQAERVTVDTGAMIVARGVGNFLKVRLPIRLDDGRTVVHLAWVRLAAEVIQDYTRRVHDGTLEGHRFEGLFGNAIEPWGEELLQAPVLLGGQREEADGSIRPSEVLDSEHPLLARILHESWPAAFVLGDRDPRRPSRS
ncbi:MULTISPECIES: DUF6348 family protein [Streptomyces]|uniref:Uncharacterized protein n=1 Tax=Streptomyces spororaveus TaxID=284039 RepID=A0ABQ3T329_9ACTN|nr:MULTISPECIES: DUF6348 family protein [Streptomyces]MCX5309281.1 DUF6348 family protein [Streptomyces sp. NBC_00160]GHI74786.1 hypothetical protein Sspor_03470 [Streptomyces spororaveus]